MDSVPLPHATDPHDLAVCAAAAIALLPAAFTGVACVVQATASHAIKPGARLRLWFWCDQALTGAECKRWLVGVPVDHAVFGAAQPIYTAAPVFAAGIVDHLPHRLALLDGTAQVATPGPAALAPPCRRSTPVLPLAAGRSRYALAALSRSVAEVASAAEGDRHATAKSAAWSLARLVRAGLLTEAEVKRTIGSAIAAAGKDASEGADIVAWDIAHRSDGGLPEWIRS